VIVTLYKQGYFCCCWLPTFCEDQFCLYYAIAKCSHVWNIQLQEYNEISCKHSFAIEVISYGGNNMVRMNNKGDAELICFMKVNFLSSLCQSQALTCTKHFLTTRIHLDIIKHNSHHNNKCLEIGYGEQPRRCWLPTLCQGQLVSLLHQCQVLKNVKHCSIPTIWGNCISHSLTWQFIVYFGIYYVWHGKFMDCTKHYSPIKEGGAKNDGHMIAFFCVWCTCSDEKQFYKQYSKICMKSCTSFC